MLSFEYSYLCLNGYAFVLGKYAEMRWLVHIVYVYLTFKETAKLLSKAVIQFYIPSRST